MQRIYIEMEGGGISIGTNPELGPLLIKHKLNEVQGMLSQLMNKELDEHCSKPIKERGVLHQMYGKPEERVEEV